jgi:hypothetical protein
VIWPPRSQLRRKAGYTALALASAVFVLLPLASPSWAGVTDDTPPIVSYSIDGIAGTNKWYRGSTHGNNITLHWSVSDPESGVFGTVGCEPAIQIPGPNTGTTRTCQASSDGGTTTITTKLLKIDAEPPTAAATTNRLPNGAGWYRTPVAISWSGTDATSGIAGCRPTLNYAGPDTTGTTVGGDCTDNAGNTSSAAISFRYDSTPPVTDAASAPAPNAAGWFRSPLSIGWSGSDVTSGIASCRPRLTYSGPDTTGTEVSGRCTDNAGNSSSGGFQVRYDTTPPAFRALARTALDGKVRLRWKVSGAAGLRVSRSPGMKRAASSDVYSGSGNTFADNRVENYVRYRYTLSAADAAGNTAARSISAVPLPVLYAPRPGARLGRTAPLLFAWRAAKKADYYNLQLWRGGHKVGSWWPSSPRLRLPSRWHSEGKTRRLKRGAYSWYVWPGRGARRLGKYGPIVGKSTFAVR